MIKYIDNGILCGWYFCNNGEFYGDGTKAEAIRGDQSADSFSNGFAKCN